MKKYKSLILLLFILISADLSGETLLSTLDEIAAFGAENNLEYKSGQAALLRAENNRQSILLLEKTTIGATGSYNDSAQSSGEAGGISTWGIKADIEIPVTEQVSLSGSINQDGDGSAAINLKPLSHSDSREQSLNSYSSALVSAEAARLNSESSALNAALNWMSASREYDTQKRQTELSGASYLDDKVRFDLGEITFDELQDSMVNWSQARVTLSEKENQFRSAESNLYSALGASKGDVSISSLTVDKLESAVDGLQSRLNREEGDFLKSSQLKLAVLSKESAAAALKNTWAYEPDLTAGASLSFDDTGYKGFAATLSFSLSLDNIQATEKEISRYEYEIASQKELQSRYEAELNFSQIIDTIESTAINRDIANIEYEQAEILLSEAELLFKRGDISEMDLEESRISLQVSENALFKALADEYLAWLSLKAYL
ncbi:TolC family protein [Spirochaeta isovalerica]|uniref:Outer membrane protein TolC n=1 Tax=Spirochaeta isovalerica TaxID=150 RepID=A0A841R4R5_9SPIO|nr:TolC family protein [Spirochaeta isovalerica]MBB6478855.1 outer membrane protein TolC [Spirochaeta isovalerica]